MNNIKCRKSTTQEYECQVSVKYRFHIEGHQNKNMISVDACLVKELFWLWDQGIETMGHCCGQHVNMKNGYAMIQVPNKFSDRMKELGYKESLHHPAKECYTFIPKTKLGDLDDK